MKMREYRNCFLAAWMVFFFLISPVGLRANESQKNCEVVAMEETEINLGERVCSGAKNFGINPTLVHAYGPGLVDVFISESEAESLRNDPEKLTRLVISLTDWVKQNSGVNLVGVTIVGRHSKIANGRKFKNNETEVNLYSTVPVFSGPLSDGKSEKDKQVAKRICKVFKDFPDILMISVQETILYVDISREFYDEMMRDKLSGVKVIKMWMRGMRKESGYQIVTVWVYVDKIKVIEGDTSWTGEDKIKFLF